MIPNTNMIETLPLTLAIRKRPGLYIGDTKASGFLAFMRALIHGELHRKGARYKRVDVTVGPQQIDMHFAGVPAHKTASAATELMARSTGRSRTDNLSIPLMVALSAEAVVEIAKGRVLRRIRYRRQQLVADRTYTRKTRADGLRLRFKPDVFPSKTFCEPEQLAGLMQMLALFAPKTVLALHWPQRDRTFVYHFPRGLVSYLRELEWDMSAVRGPGFRLLHAVYRNADGRAEVACFVRGDCGPLLMQSFVNHERTLDGGTHVDAFIASVLALQKPQPIGAEDAAPSAACLRGMTVLLAVELKAPALWKTSYFRHRLGNDEAEPLVRELVMKRLSKLLAKDVA